MGVGPGRNGDTDTTPVGIRDQLNGAAGGYRGSGRQRNTRSAFATTRAKTANFLRYQGLGRAVCWTPAIRLTAGRERDKEVTIILVSRGSRAALYNRVLITIDFQHT